MITELLKLNTKLSTFFSKILIWRYKIKIITVAGSVGKTSTKYVLGSLLNQKVPTIYQKGSYNQPFSIPFALFGLKYPDNPKNLFSWFWAYVRMLSLIIFGYKYRAAVLEVGADRPKDIIQTTSWLKSDVAILTAVTEEHMENFNNLDEVAEEEFQIFKNAKLKFASSDSISKQFIKKYGPEDLHLYGFSNKDASISKNDELTIKLNNKQQISFEALLPGNYLNQSFIVALKIAYQEFGLSKKDLTKAIGKVDLPPGRMRRFRGIHDSWIIDDTYNASPEAYKQALSLIYSLKSKRRVLVLGNMNEFGDHSKQAHQQIADYIKLNDKDIAVTIGPDANKYLFPQLKKQGVKNLFKFNDPWSVGEFLKKNIRDGDVIFLKGSQNGVFLEEAVKFILNNKEDVNLLARQSDHWMNIKLKFKESSTR